MSLIFPSNPQLDDAHIENGVAYKWNGTKWIASNKFEDAVVTEYANIQTVQGSNTVIIEPEKYNYYKIEVDGQVDIDIPVSTPFSTFILELNILTTGAIGYRIDLASYVQNLSVSAQDTSPYALFFKPDGTKMYVVGFTGRDVNEYDLSTAWDISTASYVQNFSVSAQELSPTGLFFKPDGTKMYVVGISSDAVNEYDLSTAWDISTASYVQNFGVNAQESVPIGLFFKPDGTKMYVLGVSGDAVYEYTLITAWDISTASYVQNFLVSAQDSAPYGLFFKPDGTKMFVAGANGDAVYEYTLITAWDISSASYVQNFSVLEEENNPKGIYFKPDGTKMYVVGTTGRDVNEYDTFLVGYQPDITWGSNIQWENKIAPDLTENNGNNLLIKFTTYDGQNWVGSPIATNLGVS